MTPTLQELDAVVLIHDIAEAGLRAGDLGAIVHVHAPGQFEVEFATASGKTRALIPLATSDLRPVGDDDLLAVRPTTPRRVTA